MSQVQNLTNLFTPGGRFVSGDLDKKQDKDYENKPIPPEEQEYYFAVAVEKNQPGAGELLAQLHGLATQAYQQAPQLLAQVNMGLAATGFSWKIEDGDVAKIDTTTGQPKKIPEYIQGCYVFKFRTKYEFGACDLNGTNINRADVKRGDYIDVMFTAAPNGRYDGNAGIILYPNAIRRLGFGEAISGTVDASTAFGGRQAAVPMGATAAPTATGATPPAQGNQAMGGAPATGGMPAAAGNPAAATGGMPAAGGAPVMGAGGVDPNAMGHAPQTGGMPAASSGMATTSHTDPAAAGVQPHNQILQGPQGGMVQNQGGGMPGA